MAGLKQATAEIVPAALAVKAMRDNGYKNAAYAIAELMDNSIQAGATTVDLLCAERSFQNDARKVSRIHQVAVLDNGHGMAEDVLRLALQFGNGTHLDESSDAGIGKFGMGLPSSSISQCRKVEVWSWQKGVDNALYTYLDIDEIAKGSMQEIPKPAEKEIPKLWKQVGKSFAKSGTLVVWSELDRCMWRTAGAIIDNSELLIGRIYRRFLENGNITIRLCSFDADKPEPLEKLALPNDPMYLMKQSSCPEPFHSEPMFEKWGDDAVIPINFRGADHEVTVRFSYAKEKAREEAKHGVNPGSLPHGKHAARNVGVSLVRAGRELELDQTFVNKYEPTERWWGIEVEFPPALDDLFGVTNNKQFARNFSELAQIDIATFLKGGKSWTEIKDHMKLEEDPRGPLLEIAHRVDTTLDTIRDLLKTQTRGSRKSGARRHQTTERSEKAATTATRSRQKEGHNSQSDQDEKKPEKEREAEIQKALEETGVDSKEAQQLAAKIVGDGLKYKFMEAHLDTPAFFSVRPHGGTIIVTLNTNHPASEKLVGVLESAVDEEKEEDASLVSEKLSRSLEGIKLLLMAWARYEDEQKDPQLRAKLQEHRSGWGIIARTFFETSE